MNCQPEYKNSPKNIWRNKWWKSAAFRVKRWGMRPQDARVIYQPGPRNLDRKVALRHGFLAHNLIGVDRDKALCSDLRKQGVTMICGDAVDLIAAWKPSNLPDVILLDTCSSLSKHFSKLLSVFGAGNFYNRNMVWGINVVHGRDKYLNAFKGKYSPHTPHCYNPRRNLFAPAEWITGEDGKLHRGLAIATLAMEQLLMTLGFEEHDESEKCVQAIRKALWGMDMELDQYQSERFNDDGKITKGITMDSVMFDWSNFIFNRKQQLISPKRIKGYPKKASYAIAAGLATASRRHSA